MTELLRNFSKYHDSLNGLRWAKFSVIGTGDWEDYASLSIRAMQLETLTDLERRVENLEGLLTEPRHPQGFIGGVGQDCSRVSWLDFGTGVDPPRADCRHSGMGSRSPVSDQTRPGQLTNEPLGYAKRYSTLAATERSRQVSRRHESQRWQGV